MTKELLHKRARLLQNGVLYSACAEEKLRLRICNFYLQTFSSALSWSLPSFISCSMPITKTSFSVFVGSLDWHWGARPCSRLLPGWKTPVRFGELFPEGEASVLLVEHVRRGTVHAYPHSRTHYQSLDTKCRSLKWEKMPFQLHMELWFWTRMKIRRFRGTRKSPEAFGSEIKNSTSLHPNIRQILTPKHAPQRANVGVSVQFEKEETIHHQFSVFSLMLVIKLGFLGEP